MLAKVALLTLTDITLYSVTYLKPLEEGQGLPDQVIPERMEVRVEVEHTVGHQVERELSIKDIMVDNMQDVATGPVEEGADNQETPEDLTKGVMD
jgi:hypothetical protein